MSDIRPVVRLPPWLFAKGITRARADRKGSVANGFETLVRILRRPRPNDRSAPQRLLCEIRPTDVFAFPRQQSYVCLRRETWEMTRDWVFCFFILKTPLHTGRVGSSLLRTFFRFSPFVRFRLFCGNSVAYSPGSHFFFHSKKPQFHWFSSLRQFFLINLFSMCVLQTRFFNPRSNWVKSSTTRKQQLLVQTQK